MAENNNVQPPVVEETKKKSNKVAIIIACIFGGGFLLVMLLPLIFNFFVYNYIGKKVMNSVEEATREEEKKAVRPTTEEDEIYAAEEGAISCNTKTRNLVYISYKDFDDSKLSKADACNTYVIEEFNIRLIPTHLVLDGGEVDFARWKINANGISKDLVGYGKNDSETYEYGYVSIEKFKDYYTVSFMTLGGGYTTFYIFDKDGNQVFTINAYDKEGCANMPDVVTDNTLIIKQYYIVDNADPEFGSSASCINNDKVQEKCGSNYQAVDISYELVENNGVFDLKELPNYKCQ